MSVPRRPSYFARLVSGPGGRDAPLQLLPPRLLFRPAAPPASVIEPMPGGPAGGATAAAPVPPPRPLFDRLPAGEGATSRSDAGRQAIGSWPPPAAAAMPNPETAADRPGPALASGRPAAPIPAAMSRPAATPIGRDSPMFEPSAVDRAAVMQQMPPHPLGYAPATVGAGPGLRPPAAVSGNIGSGGALRQQPAVPPVLGPPRPSASDLPRQQPLPAQEEPSSALRWPPGAAPRRWAAGDAAASPSEGRVRIGTLEVRVAAPPPQPTPAAAAPRRTAASSPPSRIARPFAAFGLGQS